MRTSAYENCPRRERVTQPHNLACMDERVDEAKIICVVLTNDELHEEEQAVNDEESNDAS